VGLENQSSNFWLMDHIWLSTVKSGIARKECHAREITVDSLLVVYYGFSPNFHRDHNILIPLKLFCSNLKRVQVLLIENGSFSYPLEIMDCFDICTHCKMIIVIKSINTSVTTHYHSVCLYIEDT
jgi:hypothetical protein